MAMVIKKVLKVGIAAKLQQHLKRWIEGGQFGPRTVMNKSNEARLRQTQCVNQFGREETEQESVGNC